jgi:lipopolysaccharide/colanic/teichoic acid biosynthesis glycosyltransferase
MFLKRLFDMVVAAILVVILMPAYIGLIITNLIFLGWPVFFVQQRSGLNGRLFGLIKFRSMRRPSAQQTGPLYTTDQERLTPYGKWLRKYSLDELPSFINILKGDLSLVGPRPLLPEFGAYYTPAQRRREEVRPGLTGLAQIKGRNNIGWRKKFQYDVWYVDNRSFCLDMKIILETFPLLFSAEGTDFPVDGYLPKKS